MQHWLAGNHGSKDAAPQTAGHCCSCFRWRGVLLLLPFCGSGRAWQLFGEADQALPGQQMKAAAAGHQAAPFICCCFAGSLSAAVCWLCITTASWGNRVLLPHGLTGGYADA